MSRALHRPGLFFVAFSAPALLLFAACSREKTPSSTDDPRLGPQVAGNFERNLQSLVQVVGESYESWTVEERLAHYHVPGLSLAVFRGGQVVLTRAYGVTESNSSAGRAVTADTLFAAGPFAMSLVSVAAAKLAQDDRVDLDASLDTLVRSWQPPPSQEGAQPTLRQLLNHIGGVAPAELPRIPGDAPLPSLAEVLDGKGGALNSPWVALYPPGFRYAYSEAGYAAAELALLDATGGDFQSLLNDLVLQPTGMTRSAFAAGAPPEALVALPHDALGEPITDFGRAPSLAADGLWTTPTDFAMLLIALQLSLYPQQEGLLSVSSATQVLRSGLSNRGLGFEVWTKGGPERLGVSGPGPGSYALAWSLRARPEGAVVLANGARAEMLCREVLQAMAREYGWLGLSPTKSDGGVTSTLLPLVGTYALASRDGGAQPTLKISLEDGRLTLTASPGVFPGEPEVRAALYPADGQYVMADRPQKIGFVWEGETLAASATFDGAPALRVTSDDTVPEPSLGDI